MQQPAGLQPPDRSDHYAVRPKEVIDGIAFAKEFGIGDHADIRPSENRSDARPCPDWDRRFDNYHTAVRKHVANFEHCVVESGHVDLAAYPHWSGQTQKYDFSICDRVSDCIGMYEAQLSRSLALPDDLRKPWLNDIHLTTAQPLKPWIRPHQRT